MSKIFNISLPDDLVQKADEHAKNSYQNRSDIIREALRSYLHEASIASPGRKIHGEAAEAREKGETLKALSLYHQALAAYQAEGDDLGFAEALADESISLRHMFEATGDKNWLILAKHDNMAGVEIAQKSGNKEALALPLFNLAKTQAWLEEYDEAVKTFKEAIKYLKENPPKVHKIEERTAVMADFKIHLAVAEYKAGDKSAIERAEAALKELEEGTEISDYNKNVWVSGGHMYLAEIYKDIDSQKAHKHLNEAKKIINSDERLVLRKKQWDRLASTF